MPTAGKTKEEQLMGTKTARNIIRHLVMVLALWCMCLSGWTDVPAKANELTIQMPGFEQPLVDPEIGYLRNPGTAWAATGNTYVYTITGVYAAALTDNQLAKLEGQQYINANNQTLSQTLTATYVAGKQYVLSCLVGQSSMWPCTGYAVQLRRGANVVAEVATRQMGTGGSAPAPSSTMLHRITVRYTAVAADNDQPITITLAGQGAALFDDVRLTELATTGHAAAPVRLAIVANTHDAQTQVLQQYLGEITQSVVAIVATEAQLAPTDIGFLLKLETQIPGLSTRASAQQGYRIVVKDKRVVLSARTERGLTYAVYGFLEDHLGVRFFAPDCEVVPQQTMLSLREMDETREPAFQVRSIFGSGGDWEIYNRGGGLPTNIMVSSHGFYDWVPPSQYLGTHPEWYPLLNGKRQQHWLHGLCYSNPELATQLAANIMEQIRTRKLPASVPIKVGQGDGFIACGCDVCRKVAKENASEAGPVILLLNRILEAMNKAYPDYQLITFAYADTMRMPTAIKPHPNLWINIVSSGAGGEGGGPFSGGDMIGPVRNNPQNAAYQQAIEQWTKVAPGHVAIWHWSTDFGDHSIEWPNLFTMADNIRFWREQQVAAVALQTTGGEGNWGWLKHWVWLHLLWNPNADINTLVHVFLAGYYGSKAEPILWEYLQLVEQTRRQSKYAANACDYGSNNALAMLNNLFPSPVLARMDALLEQATQAALTEKDPVYAQRIQHARAYAVDQLKLVEAAGVQPYPGGHFYPPETVKLSRIQDPRDGSFWMVPGTTPDMPARVARRDEALKTGGAREWGAGFLNRFWFERGAGGKLTRLESPTLAVEICPNLVGTLTSLIHKPSGKELLAGRFPLYEWHTGMQAMEWRFPELTARHAVMEQWIQTHDWAYQGNMQRYFRTIDLAEDAAAMRITRNFIGKNPGNAPGMPNPTVFPSQWTFQVPNPTIAGVRVTARGERKVIAVREKGVTDIPLTRIARGEPDAAAHPGTVSVAIDRGDGLVVTLLTPEEGWDRVSVTTDPDAKTVMIRLVGMPLSMVREKNAYNLPGIQLEVSEAKASTVPGTAQVNAREKLIPIPVPNASFETPVVPEKPGYQENAGLAWASTGKALLYSKTYGGTPGALSTDQQTRVNDAQIILVDNCSVSQTLPATYTPGKEYQLTCLVGSSTGIWFGAAAGYAVQLKCGATVLAEVATSTMGTGGNAQAPSPTTLDLVTVRYKAIAVDADKPITIVLASKGKVIFDDIKLCAYETSEQ